MMLARRTRLMRSVYANEMGIIIDCSRIQVPSVELWSIRMPAQGRRSDWPGDSHQRNDEWGRVTVVVKNKDK